MPVSWLLNLALSATATGASKDWFLCGPQYQIRPNPTPATDPPDWIVYHPGCSEYVSHGSDYDAVLLLCICHALCALCGA